MRIANHAISHSVLLLTILLSISMLLWMHFLAESGVSLETWVTLNGLDSGIAAVSSLPFILFVLLFPLSYEILMVMVKRYPRPVVMGSGVVSFFLASVAAGMLFPRLLEFSVIGLFYLISLLAVTASAYVKYRELKSQVNARVAWNAAGTGTIIVGIGIIAAVMLLVAPNQDFYINDLEEGILELAQDSFQTNPQSGLAASAADLLLESQRNFADALIANPLFSRLRTKTDRDVVAFVTAVDVVRETLDSEEAREELIEELNAQQNSALSGNQAREIFNTLPGYRTFTEYYWLIAGLLVFSFFLVLRIPFTVIGMVQGVLLGAIADHWLPLEGNAGQAGKRKGQQSLGK